MAKKADVANRRGSMAEREGVLDEPAGIDEQAQALRQANERAERAEAELARLKKAQEHRPAAEHEGAAGGEAELRKDSMMAHLLDSLAAGKDIGHYGRLVFAMVAHHFLSHGEVLEWLTKDKDFDEGQARLMLHQVEGRDYNPPRRDRILEWQSLQEFPILPFPEDPDCGNLYRNLKFPDAIYHRIGQYEEAKMEAGG